MIDIFLTVILFSFMLIIFKLLGKFKVDNLQAIVINYFVAGIMALYFYRGSYNVADIFRSNWFTHAFTIGLLFIVCFNAIAVSAQKVGLAITTIANKMSLIIPVLVAIILYNEGFRWQDGLAILMALGGIFLSSTNKGKTNFQTKYIWLVILIFILQGIADAVFNDANHNKYTQAGPFFGVLFMCSGILGSLMIMTQLIGSGKKLYPKALLWGVLLGVPNYGTLFFFDRALTSSGLESKEIFPVISMGIIIMSAIAGWLLFREDLTLRNWGGILLAIGAIGVITFL